MKITFLLKITFLVAIPLAIGFCLRYAILADERAFMYSVVAVLMLKQLREILEEKK